ncbi:cupin domain-containing protein [Georgenia deserti]|uniref:Cupin domain-containing protein n=1 Tax=Georgenia deserti TaxID=2093781 RepID=A0ABW4L2P4_9MICO
MSIDDAGRPVGGGASFPGGVSVSHLKVYDWPAPDLDGVTGGGSPHLHTVSGEAYVVLGGHGRVQTISSEGYAEQELRAGTVFWFTPGTVHRLVNDGDLEILVVMQNAGLPEAGDAVLTMPSQILADPDRYAEAVALPVAGAAPEEIAAAARRRRDLALEGYATLRADLERDGIDALHRLHEAAAQLVRAKVPGWQQTWAGSVGAQARAAEDAMTSLAQGLAGHLAGAATHVTTARPGPRTAGMCGWLRTYPLPPLAEA